MRPFLSHNYSQIWKKNKIVLSIKALIFVDKFKWCVIQIFGFTYFGAQIMAIFAKYPLEKAKKHIKMMNM